MDKECQNSLIPERAPTTSQSTSQPLPAHQKHGLMDSQSVTGTQYKTGCLRHMNIKTVTSPTSYHPP
jgi:hypothetical protein